ncbi:MAG: hypothetical protein ACOX0Z_00725 [Candidatus Nanosyncoccaceae bacterium]|jgi:hypothetical protein
MASRESKQEKLLKTLKDYQTWQLVLILILFSFVVVILLRLNNTGMVSRREALLAADEEGNSEITRERATDLRVYVNRHMNTSTGRFFLKGQYARDSEAVKIKAEEMASGNPHGNVYKKASEACDPLFRYRSADYFQCYLNELAKYPAAEYGSIEVKMPEPNLYQKEFVSPLWTPDFAGFAVLGWIFLASVVTLRLIYKIILLIILKKVDKRL